MENSQAAYINVGRQVNQDQNISDDHYWKALYSHSFTAVFTCENCDNQFDIDGWFYKFDSVVCPKCKSVYSGFFGRVLPLNQPDCIDLETFDGQRAQISLKSRGKSFPSLSNHIILVLSSKILEKQEKLWGIIDYSESKPHLQLLSHLSGNREDVAENKNNGKSKSFFSTLFG